MISDPLEGMVWYELRRASLVAMGLLTRALEPLELRPSEASILIIIGANTGATQSDLSRSTGLKQANLVPIISRLLHSGALSRKPGEGRALPLLLTADGEKLRSQVMAIMQEIDAQVSQGLSVESRRLFLASTRSMFENGKSDLLSTLPSGR